MPSPYVNTFLPIMSIFFLRSDKPFLTVFNSLLQIKGGEIRRQRNVTAGYPITSFTTNFTLQRDRTRICQLSACTRNLFNYRKFLSTYSDTILYDSTISNAIVVFVHLRLQRRLVDRYGSKLELSAN